MDPDQEVRAAALGVAASLFAGRGMNRNDRRDHELAKPLCALAEVLIPYIRDGSLADDEGADIAPPFQGLTAAG